MNNISFLLKISFEQSEKVIIPNKKVTVASEQLEFCVEISNSFLFFDKMDTDCTICLEVIADETKAMTCDGCENSCHLKCIGVTKKERDARTGSTHLRIYCNDCCTDTVNVTADNVKQLLKFVVKIDAELQKQREHQATSDLTISTMSKKLIELDGKFGSVEKCLTAKNMNTLPQPATRPNIVTRKNVKPAVIIKPKTQQNCEKTLEAITNSVSIAGVNVCGTRNAREGGIVLRCANATETMKVKNMVNEKLSNEYEVELPKIKNPRVRVTNIPTEIAKESIINALIENNDELKDHNISLITVLNRKATSHRQSSNDIVIEVNSVTYNLLLNMQTLKLPWRECKIYDHIYVKRCYKCLGFSHLAKDCEKNQMCSKCGGNHKYSECKSNKLCCANCRSANEKFKTKIDIKHHAWSKECPVYKRRIESLVSKIEYNESE